MRPHTSQGFPNKVDWCGNNLDKMGINCIKITKSVFLGQKSVGGRGYGEGKTMFRVVGVRKSTRTSTSKKNTQITLK